MLEVKEVETRKQQKEFVEFPLKMYKDNPYFVPPLYGDEMKIFRKDYTYYDTCEAVYYNAYRDGKMVGRICGILQKASNAKNNEKRVRFDRFDALNDQEVAEALFRKVEDWARSKGMDTMCGPLGFSDLEREGLLVEGFDQLSTFEEQYNADYYQDLIEACGYRKEVDWVESKLYPPKEEGENLKKMADFVLKRYNLHIGTAKNTKEWIKKYSAQLFELLDRSYEKLYGTVPFTKATKDLVISNFNLIIDMEHVAVILDENEKVVCIGVCFPSLAKAVQKSQGHLTPLALLRVLKAIKHPEIIDLGLIGVDPEYENRGISVVFSSFLIDMLSAPGVSHAETNLNLEDNANIRNMWKRFNAVQHKRRRSYMKKLS